MTEMYSEGSEIDTDFDQSEHELDLEEFARAKPVSAKELERRQHFAYHQGILAFEQLTEKNRRKFLGDLLHKLPDPREFTISTAEQGRELSYFNFPKNSAKQDSLDKPFATRYRNFWKNFIVHAPRFEKFLIYVFGNLSWAFAVICNYYFKNHNQIFNDVMNELNFSQSLPKLSAYEAVAMQRLLKLSTAKNRKLKKYLRTLKIDVFPTNKEMETLKNPYKGTLKYTDDKYYHISLKETFLNHLKMFQEAYPKSNFGVTHNTFGNIVSLTLAIDKGGDETKCIVTINLTEKDKLKFYYPIMWYKGNETYEELKASPLTEIDGEIAELFYQNILFIPNKNGDSFHYFFTPRHWTDVNQLDPWNRNADAIGVRYKDKEKGKQSKIKFKAPIKQEELCLTSALLLPIHVFLTGDLKCLFTCQGREHHSGSKCLYCDCMISSTNSVKQQPYEPQYLFTQENSRAFIGKELGFSAVPLFKNIPFDHWVGATLHLKLGIGKVLVDAVQDFSKKYGAEVTCLNILSKHSVDRRSYHGGAITGPHMDNMLNKREKILSEIHDELLKIKEVRELDTVKSSEFKEFFKGMQTLLTLFSEICHYMKKCNVLSSKELIRFNEVNKSFCGLYRAFTYCKDHITPKFHLLESHMYKLLTDYGRLGIYSEEVIESFHRIKNEFNSNFKNTRDRKLKEERIYNRLSVTFTPEFRIQESRLERPGNDKTFILIPEVQIQGEVFLNKRVREGDDDVVEPIKRQRTSESVLGITTHLDAVCI